MSNRSQGAIIGQQIGNYRLVRWLGQGSFADVYLGEHIYLKRHAAIKILKMSLSSTDHESFLREARTVAALDHPHIVRVLEYGIEDKTPFLIMNYATNGSMLQRYPRGTRLTLTEALPYIQQAAAALHHAHQQKLIHRDVKPENMLLDSRSELLLSDFGLVLAYQSFNSFPTSIEIAGTALYMAPEQFQGKAQFASDQYALAVVAYEWLCGERPFKGTLTEITNQHMLMPPPSLRAKVPTVPEVVEQVIMRALSKDPEQRFSNVEAFADAMVSSATAPSPTYSILAFQSPAASPSTSHASLPFQKLALLLVGVLIFLIGSGSLLLLQSPTQVSKQHVQPINTSSSIKATSTSQSFQPQLASSPTHTSQPSLQSPSQLFQSPTTTPPTPAFQSPVQSPFQSPTATPPTPAFQSPVQSPFQSPTATPPTPTPSPACLSVTPTSLTFLSILGQDPPTQVITVKNCGNSSSLLNYTTASKWILVQPSATTINGGASVDVIIRVSSSNELLGLHNGSVDFALGTAHQIVTVNYTVS